jgi:hypothetical protein
MSFDLEMEAEIYVGATKESKRLCWEQAKMFVESPYQTCFTPNGFLLYAKDNRF